MASRSCLASRRTAKAPLPVASVEDFARWSTPLVTLITLLGLAIRAYTLDSSLWLDELHTSWTVGASANQLADRAALGNNSPGYFWIVRTVVQTWGHEEWTLRVVSLLAGVTLIPLTYAICRSWRCAVVPSLLAAVMVAVDRHAHFYACEARTYALVQLVALVHVALLVRALTIRSANLAFWGAWVFTGMALFQLHCTTGLFLVAEAVAIGGLIVFRQPIEASVWRLCAGLCLMGVSSVANLELFAALAERRDNWSHFIRATGQPSRMIGLFPLDNYMLVPAVASGIMPLIHWCRGKRGCSIAVNQELPSGAADGSSRPLSAWWVDRWRSLADIRGGADRVPIVVVGACLVVPVVLAWSLTELSVTRLFLRRYLMASSVTLAPLLALLMTSLATPRGTSWAAAVVLLWTLVTSPPAVEGRVQEDWRGAVRFLNQQQEQTSVLLYSGLIEADPWWNDGDPRHRDYCEFPLRALYTLDEERSVLLLPRTVPRIDCAEYRDAAPGWLLIRSSRAKRAVIEQAVLESLGAGWGVADRFEFGRLQLVRIQCRE